MDVWSFVVSGVWTLISGVLIFILQQQIKENRSLKKEKEAKRSARDAALETGMVCILRKHLMDEHECWEHQGLFK